MKLLRRLLLAAVTLAALQGPQVFAAGQVVTVTIQDGTGTHQTQQWDVSGTGAGPFLPIFVGGSTVGIAGSAKSATSALTSVVSAAADTSLLAATSTRTAFSVVNDSTAVLYLKNNAGAASTTSYTIQIAPGGYYRNDDWTGAVRGIWASANGNARITEYTP